MLSMPNADEVIGWFQPCRRPSLKQMKWTMRTQMSTAHFGPAPILGEALLETLFHQCAEIAPFVTALHTQPFTARVEDSQGTFDYTPDGLALCPRGWCVVECKPSRQYLHPEVSDRLTRLNPFFLAHGLTFVVLDEHDVGGWGLQTNLARLWRVRQASELDSAADGLVERLHSGDQTTRAQLRGNGVTDFVIDRALVTSKVFTDLHDPIDDQTALRTTPFGDHRDLLSKLVRPFFAHELPAVPCLWEVQP